MIWVTVTFSLYASSFASSRRADREHSVSSLWIFLMIMTLTNFSHTYSLSTKLLHSAPHIPHPNQTSSSLLRCALDLYSLIFHELMRPRAPPQARVPLYTRTQATASSTEVFTCALAWMLISRFSRWGGQKHFVFLQYLFLTLTTFTTSSMTCTFQYHSCTVERCNVSYCLDRKSVV